MNKHPRYLKPQDTPTATQRKSLGLGAPCKPEPRHPAAMRAVYRVGDGEQRGMVVAL